jgi:hypothetical protein
MTKNQEPQTLFEQLYKSILPIVYIDHHKNVHVAGTCIYIEHRSIKYILSAAHTFIDPGNKTDLFLSLEHSLVHIPGPVWLSRDANGVIDARDISIFPIGISTDISSSLEEYFPIELIPFNNDVLYATSNYYYFGFPHRKAKYDRSSKTLVPKPLDYQTIIIDDEELYAKFKTHTDTHIITSYDKNNTVNASRIKVTPPLPHGASGGPLFKMLGDENNDLITMNLEGVMTTYKEKKYIVSTRISSVREFIDSIFIPIQA